MDPARVQILRSNGATDRAGVVEGEVGELSGIGKNQEIAILLAILWIVMRGGKERRWKGKGKDGVTLLIGQRPLNIICTTTMMITFSSKVHMIYRRLEGYLYTYEPLPFTLEQKGTIIHPIFPTAL